LSNILKYDDEKYHLIIFDYDFLCNKICVLVNTVTKTTAKIHNTLIVKPPN